MNLSSIRRVIQFGNYPRQMTQGGFPRLTIGTHDGSFHCDEALGCWMLKKTTRFQDAEVIRTRDKDRLKTLDVVLDVGDTYDPEGLRFDHHQRGFDHVFGHGHSIKLSSAGLTYRHFGKEVLANVVHPKSFNAAEMESLYLKVYEGFIKAIDGIDNGVNPWEGDLEPKYTDSTTLASRVSRLNPSWNETSNEITENSQFAKAMELCGTEFTEYVLNIALRWLPARSHVLQSLEERFSVHGSGEIILLESFCPWKAHLLDLEDELKIKGMIKYCVFSSGKDYRVQTVPVSLGSFDFRLGLPKEWRSLRAGDLDAATGIEGCVFVHASGFIGGHATKEGALEMAKKALTLSRTDAESSE